MVQSRPDHPQLRYRVLGSTDPKKYAEVMQMRDKLPLEKWLPLLERAQPKHSDWEVTAYSSAPLGPEPTRVGSLAVAGIDSVPTCKEFIDNIIREAEELVESYPFLKMG